MGTNACTDTRTHVSTDTTSTDGSTDTTSTSSDCFATDHDDNAGPDPTTDCSAARRPNV